MEKLSWDLKVMMMMVMIMMTMMMMRVDREVMERQPVNPGATEGGIGSPQTLGVGETLSGLKDDEEEGGIER